eukprot:SAG31_NODE_7323_length_1719_cov_1.064198_1_plen_374_part_10
MVTLLLPLLLLRFQPAAARRKRASAPPDSGGIVMTSAKLPTDTYLTRAVEFHNMLTVEECAAVRRYRGLAAAGTVAGQETDEDPVGVLRSTKMQWLPRSAETNWLYKRVISVARKANRDAAWNYDSMSSTEDIQLSIYDANADPPGHYDWHADVIWSPDSSPARQGTARMLSLSVQLSDESEYDGGELQIGLSNMTKEIGTAVVFPSFELHKVHPVLRGTRASLVVWIHGSDPPDHFWAEAAMYPEDMARSATNVGVGFPIDLEYRAVSLVAPIKLYRGLLPEENATLLLEQALVHANREAALAERLFNAGEVQLLLSYKMLVRYSEAVGDVILKATGLAEQTLANCMRAVQLLAHDVNERILAQECQAKWEMN